MKDYYHIFLLISMIINIFLYLINGSLKMHLENEREINKIDRIRRGES